MTIRIFDVGDTVYVATYGNHQEFVTCPVCFGKRDVTLILGDESRVTVPCNYCRLGGNRAGQVSEYVESGKVEQFIIDRVDIASTTDGRTATYYTSSRCFNQTNTFATKDEAQDHADTLAAAHNHDLRTRAEHIKADQNKTYTWNVGYHRRNAKKKRQEADRHDELAKICKERAKT